MFPRADDGASVVTFIKTLLKRLAGFPFNTKKKDKKLLRETRRRSFGQKDLQTVNLNVTVQQQKQHEAGQRLRIDGVCTARSIIFPSHCAVETSGQPQHFQLGSAGGKNDRERKVWPTTSCGRLNACYTRGVREGGLIERWRSSPLPPVTPHAHTEE